MEILISCVLGLVGNADQSRSVNLIISLCHWERGRLL